MKDELFNYNEIDGDITKEVIINRASFYNQEQPVPLFYDSSYVSLYNSIVNDKDIVSSSSRIGGLTNIKNVKDSSYLWDAFGFDSHQVFVYDGEIEESNNHLLLQKIF